MVFAWCFAVWLGFCLFLIVWVVLGGVEWRCFAFCLYGFLWYGLVLLGVEWSGWIWIVLNDVAFAWFLHVFLLFGLVFVCF